MGHKTTSETSKNSILNDFKDKALKVGGDTIDMVKEKSGEFIDDTKRKIQINKLKDLIAEEKIKIGKEIYYKKIKVIDTTILEAKENIDKYKNMLAEKEKLRNEI